MAAQVFGDRWEIQEPLREGGQAHTFRVIDRTGDRHTSYVLKRLKNVRRLERFRTEVETLKSIDHPNVIKLIDWDLEAERPYLVSEFCAGADLEANAGHLNHDPLQALHLCAQICEGVAAVHQRGIVHRDLKPSNILLRQSEGPPVVADFGICYVEDGQRHTLTEEAVGPRLFMAPELEDGRAEEITPVADVYSLGKLLYWLIGGGQVFNREQHRDQRWNLTFICQDPSLEHVNRLLDQMIVYEPGQRLQFASQVARRARDVARLLRGGYRAVSPNIPQLCTYCGEGNYHLVARGNDTSIYNFGLNRVGQANWRVLACDQCGHVQFFRVDYAQRKEWWGEKP